MYYTSDTETEVGYANLVAFLGTSTVVPYPFSQVTAAYLNIGSQQIPSAGIQYSNKML